MNQVDETSGEMFAGIDGKLQRLIFQSYMSRADKVVVLLDGGLKVRAINEYGLLVLKLERETVVGRPWLAEFVDAEARDTLREDYEELQRTGTSKPAKNECRLRVGEGKTGMFAWQHFLVKGKLGKVEAILSVGEDVE